MRPLSDTRRLRATAYGHAVAISHLRDYAENPGNFPKGLPSLPGLAKRMARSGVALTRLGVTEEERDVAGEAARDLVTLAMAYVALRDRREKIAAGRAAIAEVEALLKENCR